MYPHPNFLIHSPQNHHPVLKAPRHYIVVLFVLLPLLTVVYLSLVSAWSFPQLLRASYTGTHWASLFAGNADLVYSLGRSLLLATSLAALATVFGFAVSKQLLFQGKQAGLLRLAFYPYLIAPVVLGAMLQFYFVRWGLTGTLFGVWIAQALFILPYGVLLMATFWTDRLRQLAFQATSLGATARQVNRTVLLPLARPWLLLCFVQTFLISWFEYGITQLVGVGKVDTLTIQAMHFVREANPHRAALAACLMIFPLLLLFAFNRRLLTRRAL